MPRALSTKFADNLVISASVHSDKRALPLPPQSSCAKMEEETKRNSGHVGGTPGGARLKTQGNTAQGLYFLRQRCTL